MSCAAPTKVSGVSAHAAVVGVDVGGARKGFHAVAIADGRFLGHLATKDEGELVHWCRDTVRARVVAIDAPCRWSKDGRARPAERQLMEKRIWCFSTPTRQRALDHPRNHFGWMLRGAALFKALESTHALCRELPIAEGKNYCFETFPHAIAWHLLSGRAVASRKREQRRELLERSGVDAGRLTNIDLVDAALCALVAHLAVSRAACAGYGEPDTGLIVVPALA